MRLYRSRRSGFARAAIAACVALLLAAALLVPPQQHARPAAADTPAATPLTPSLLLRRAAVPTTAECVRAGLGPCYTPAQIRAAYNIQQLIDAGIDGSGQTIVIIDSFGSPTLLEDVAAFSAAMGLPPADVEQLYPLGNDFSTAKPSDLRDWAGETTLDVEWAHAIAPGAKIVVLVSPVAETEGVEGLPEFRALLTYALDHHLGNVVSQSWATTENWLADEAGAAERQAWDALYARAVAEGVTILSASGDHGPLADTRSGGIGTTRAANWPATEPMVTAVGGTALTLNADGSYGSETVWRSSHGASGSGVSMFYAEPTAQQVLPGAVQQRLGGMRGIADVSAVASGLVTYYAANGGHPAISGGTSASTPIWAGIVALADQLAGTGLGNINPTLYALGAAGSCFHDVTEGNNHNGLDPGESAGPGWDFPTGWGTPDAACLVPALVAAAEVTSSP